MYDYLLVGAGLFAGVFAHAAREKGKKCLVIEKRSHIGGNVYCEKLEGINIHKYGAHIFHTSNKSVWDYINRFADFNNYVNSPIANFKGELFNLPFNMNTFTKMWGLVTPDEVKAKIEAQKREITEEPSNLEEQAISLVGKDIYLKLIKGYTEKQWGRDCKDLPAFIIKRLPVRYTFDNNYFNDPYQGIPIGGYNPIIEKMFAGCDIVLETDFNENREEYLKKAKKIVYTGQLDDFFDFSLGKFEYRSLRFETERIESENYQGVAVMNYTDRETPYTRIIEHKHFEFGKQPVTYITREYSMEWQEGREPYYPVNDIRNQELLEKYKKLAQDYPNVIFGGRLAEYKYYDMDKTIEAALKLVETELGEEK
ncbi:MAG: UDP-galactopyranose mutase [Clostridiales bacterium]|nr:UDP-galactopyranose mutase [Clostridiales bacterium]